MIPKGYQLQVSTWENDLDNYHTQILSGLTKENVLFYIELANKFSRDDTKKNGYGNSYVGTKTLIDIVKELIDKHPNITKDLMDDWVEVYEDARKNLFSEDEENFRYGAAWIHELLTDTILGYPSECYCDVPNFCKVVDKIAVFYIPEDAQDVTNQFIGD